MARPRIDDFWEMQIKRIVADNPSDGPKAIRTRLVRLGKEQGRTDKPPEDRTIRGRKKAFLANKEEVVAYRSFSWPDSMGTPDLPWEAAPYALHLLGYRSLRELERPTIRFTRWYWRVSLAAPDAPGETLYEMAAVMAASEIVPLPEKVRDVECCLAFAPWRSPENAAIYEEAKSQLGTKDPSLMGAEIPGGTDLRMVAEILSSHMPYGVAMRLSGAKEATLRRLRAIYEEMDRLGLEHGTGAIDVDPSRPLVLGETWRQRLEEVKKDTPREPGNERSQNQPKEDSGGPKAE